MDVKDLLESLDYSKENIHRQALVYSFSNILTLSLLSDFGIKYDLSDKEIDNFIEKLNMKADKIIVNDEKSQVNSFTNEETQQNSTNKKFTLDYDYSFAKKLSPKKAIYSIVSSNTPCNDENSTDTHTELDFDNQKTFKGKLIPKNQGLLIINEVNLSKFLYDKSIIKENQDSTYTEKLIGMILLDSAINQALFSYTHLRNSKGLLVKKENAALDLSELNLNEIDENIDWEDQVYMLWAYAALYETLNDTKYNKYFQSTKVNTFKNYAFNLLNTLQNHENEIIELDTARLSSLTSSIIEALNILDKKRDYKAFVVSLCDEIYTRQKEKGFMLSNRYEKETASLASHFKSIEALTNGFEYTNLELFLNTSEKIYKNLNTIWDENMGLYKLNKNDDIKYSSKSISYVLKSLNKLSNTTNSSELKQNISNQLANFFDASINDTGLQSTPPSLNKEINMFRNPVNETSVIENIIDNKSSYVIKKGFKINKFNLKINQYSNNLSCEHALFASDAMLNIAMNDSFK